MGEFSNTSLNGFTICGEPYCVKWGNRMRKRLEDVLRVLIVYFFFFGRKIRKGTVQQNRLLFYQNRKTYYEVLLTSRKAVRQIRSVKLKFGRLSYLEWNMIVRIGVCLGVISSKERGVE